jgi:putative spermidine/putrescine transport system substrate-binding protein
VQTQTVSSESFDINNWDSIVAAANGQTVNWYIWGGSESINSFVDNFYGEALKDRYNITLNRVPVADTVDAVNQVLSEKQAGKDPGAVDLIWINGENFATLKQADLLYRDWANKLPNSQYVNWDNPAINRDFGTPVDFQESPWSSAQFQFIYDSARMQPEELPRSYAQLKDWAIKNPGRFTYIAPGPGAFQGTRFVKGALFEISGGADQWSTSTKPPGINGSLNCGHTSMKLNLIYGARARLIQKMRMSYTACLPTKKSILVSPRQLLEQAR